MSRLFGPIFQVAYVVTDFNAAIAHWTGTIGVGPLLPLPDTIAVRMAQATWRTHD